MGGGGGEGVRRVKALLVTITCDLAVPVTHHRTSTSVADPGCLSWIPDPDFYPSRIPDPGSLIPDPGSLIPNPGSLIPDPGSLILDPKTAMKDRGEKKICCHTFFLEP